MENKNKKVYILLISIYCLALLTTLILKKDLFIVTNMVIVVVLISYYLLKNDYVLLIAGLVLVLLSNGISKYIAIFQYVPIYLYILMLIKLYIMKKKRNYDLALTAIVAVSIILSIIPLIIWSDFNILNIMYSILKRYGFIIIVFYVTNIKQVNARIKIEKILTIIILSNFPIFLIQFLNNTDRDFITGLLGNNFTGMIFQIMSILLCIKLGKYYNREIKIDKIIFWIVLIIIYSAIAEVKFGFFVLAILLIYYFIFIKKGIKSIIALLISLFIMMAGYNLYLDKYSHQDFLNTKFLKYYLVEQNYSGQSINRFGFKDRIDLEVFNGNKDASYIGRGIGTGNPSNFKFLQGSVNKNKDYLKYYWFTLPYIYVESGIIGICLFLLIYIYSMWKCFHNINKDKTSRTIILINIVNLIFILYNNSILSYEITFIYWILYAEFIKSLKVEG